MAEPGRRTTHKIKYVAREPQRHVQHVFHAYGEEHHAASPATGAKLRAWARKALAEANALILSDYGNGTLAPGFVKWLLEEGRRRGITTCANARGDLRKFRGVTAAVANREELGVITSRAVGRGDFSAATEEAAAKLGARYLIITAGEEGMYVWPVRGRARRIRSAARAVVDVTGAGDTVTAALAAALGAGARLLAAAEFANLAAAAVLACEGTATAAREALRRLL